MKSPFPGMDPYLEKYWREVHEGLVIYTRDQLRGALPQGLRARVEQRVLLEQESGLVGIIYPDVHVVEHKLPVASAQPTDAAVAVEEEPLLITPQFERPHEGYIEIVDASSGNRVITVIEFLSPTNKVQGADRERYLQKQREVRDSGAHLVEIDLTRRGRWTLAVAEDDVPTQHRTTYRVCVWRAEPRWRYEWYRAPLLRRLPAIRIPLRPSDADVKLDLQPLIDRCYEMGDYDDFDYRAEPDPPLDAEDVKAADDWLRSKGLR